MDQRHYLAPLFDPASVLVIGDAAPADEPWFGAMVEGLEAAFGAAPVFRLGRRGARGSRRSDDAREAVANPDGTPVQRPARSGDALAVIHVRDSGRIADALELARSHGASAAVAIEGTYDAGQHAAIRQVANSLGIRLLGPATLGFIRPSAKLNAGRLGPLPKAGNVALVAQSGALAASVMDWSAETPTGFSLVVSLGAEADIELADVLDFLATDSRTKSVVLHLEAVRHARTFMSAMRALATVKPVVVLRGGRGAPPGRRVRTHSGALVGADAVYSAALRRAGAVEIRMYTQMFTAARYLAARHWPFGKRIAVIANGSGPALLAADQAQFQRLVVEPFSGSTVAALAGQLPGVSAVNPLVLGVAASAAHHEAAIGIVARDPAIDGILVVHSPALGVDSAAVTAAVAAAGAKLHKPLFACWLGSLTTRHHRQQLDASGLPSFRTPETAVDAFGTVATFYENQRLLQQVPRSLSALERPDLDRARAIVEASIGAGRDVLGDAESQAMLQAFRIPFAPAVVVADPDEAIAAAGRAGYPVVLKIASADIAHRSDVGGVALDVRSADEVRAQFEAIVERVRAARADAAIDGVGVQPMVSSRDGVELHVGMVRDPVFGPTISFGAGGISIERIRDATVGFPPLNRFLADSMIARTRIGEELERRRAAWPRALPALERILVRVSEMACELPQIVEMDINPLIVDANGAVAVDARIVLDMSAAVRAGGYAHMAILPYPEQLVRERALADGTAYQLRPIRPEDGDALQGFVRGLSERSRYFRFISSMSELTPRMLARYTQVDYDRELALVAVLRAAELPSGDEPAAGDRIIGVVRYLRNPDGESCEFAIAIDDGHQGKGLGTQLMAAIVDAARDKGLRRIEGFVLGENRGMLRLMRATGFTIATDPDDPTMRLVHRELR